MSRAYYSDFSDSLMAFEEIILASKFTKATVKTKRHSLHRFDDFCVEKNHSTGILDKEIVDSFSDKYPSCAGVIRQFAEYLRSIGKDFYILPKRQSAIRIPTPFEPQSGLAHWMKEFVESKRASGFKCEKECTRFRLFDRYLCESEMLNEELTQEMFERYAASLTEISYSSKTSYLYTIKALAGYIVKNGGKAWICESIKHPVPPVPEYITEESLPLFFGKLDEIQFRYSWLQYVYSVLFRLLYSTGMRKGEACTIFREDIEWNKNRIRLRAENTKNKKERYIYISEFDVLMLRKYDVILESYFPNRRYLFVGAVLPETKALNPGCLCRVFKMAWDLTGLPGNPTIHSLRHGYTVDRITHWYQEGKNAKALIPYLSNQLGHENISSTYWYCKQLDTKFREILDLGSPADKVPVPKENKLCV